MKMEVSYILGTKRWCFVAFLWVFWPFLLLSENLSEVRWRKKTGCRCEGEVRVKGGCSWLISFWFWFWFLFLVRFYLYSFWSTGPLRRWLCLNLYCRRPGAPWFFSWTCISLFTVDSLSTGVRSCSKSLLIYHHDRVKKLFEEGLSIGLTDFWLRYKIYLMGKWSSEKDGIEISKAHRSNPCIHMDRSSR